MVDARRGTGLSAGADPELFGRLARWRDRPAVIDGRGSWSYAALTKVAAGLARLLLDGRPDLDEERVGLLFPPGARFVSALLAIWRAGGIAVPLAPAHPLPELVRTVLDSDSRLVLGSEECAGALDDLGRATGRPCRVWPAAPGDDDLPRGGRLPRVEGGRRALILYTSGTTAHPKGVVLTHAALQAQVRSLEAAWEWSPDDRLLHVLPLHHIHGLVVALLCSLWSGAACRMLPRFDAGAVWSAFASEPVTLFMAVPTIYERLIAAWEAAPPGLRGEWSAAAGRLRLMTSGSAPLPATTLRRWETLTGHRLLERYGMSETGMILSNPLRGDRVPGHVGVPLPGVEVKLVRGEVRVRGDGVFREYWRQPAATAAAFAGGWFRTGDAAVRAPAGYRLLGRLSGDILKTGGYKVSALEIEEALREHPAIRECAVVGIDDREWGQRVCAAVVVAPGAALDLAALREWARPRIAAYKIPRQLVRVTALPRNAMGKVDKPELRRRLSHGPDSNGAAESQPAGIEDQGYHDSEGDGP